MMFERGWVQGVLACSTFATFDHIWENGPSQLRCLRRLKQSTKNLLDSLSPCALRQRCCQSCQSTNRNLRWLEFGGKAGLWFHVFFNDNPQWSTMYRQYIFKLGWNSWSHQEKDAKCCHEKEHVSSILRFVVAHQSKQAKLLGFMQPLQPPWSVLTCCSSRPGSVARKLGWKIPWKISIFSDSSDIPGWVVDQWLGDFGKPF